MYEIPISDLQVMETKNMLYIVTEYANNGEMFGKSDHELFHQTCQVCMEEKILLMKASNSSLAHMNLFVFTKIILPATVIWVRMKLARSSGKSSLLLNIATDAISYIETLKLKIYCWTATWTSNWQV